MLFPKQVQETKLFKHHSVITDKIPNGRIVFLLVVFLLFTSVKISYKHTVEKIYGNLLQYYNIWFLSFSKQLEVLVLIKVGLSGVRDTPTFLKLNFCIYDDL